MVLSSMAATMCCFGCLLIALRWCGCALLDFFIDPVLHVGLFPAAARANRHRRGKLALLNQ